MEGFWGQNKGGRTEQNKKDQIERSFHKISKNLGVFEFF